jgi:hypothetical protein
MAVEVGMEPPSSVTAFTFAAPAQKGAPQGAGLPLLARVPLKKVAARMQTTKVKSSKSMLVVTVWSFRGWKGNVIAVVEVVVVE